MKNLETPKTLSETGEDYLRAIYLLSEQQTAATTSRLAEHLQVAPATVTSMLKRLGEQGWVEYHPYQGATVTAAGQMVAMQVLRSHRLAETFLVEVLGMPWDCVHMEAHRWEHALSPDVIDRMDALLGYPSHDPHGDPIPDADGRIAKTSTQQLLDLSPGAVAEIDRVRSQDFELLRYLGELGLRPSAKVEVIARAPFEGPLTVKVNGCQQVIGRQVACQIFVRPESETTNYLET